MSEVAARPVLHVNDCAGVAQTLVSSAVAQGLPWRLFLPSPRRRHPIKTGQGRVGELLLFKRQVADVELLHVHYGLMAYYAARARRPFVLHLHGSDVHRDLNVAGRRRVIDWGIRRAAGVVFSTPDMTQRVTALRPDATWFPGPVSIAALERPIASVATAGEATRIVFCSRWDPVKGAEEQVAAIAGLRAALPGAELIGLDWGPLAGQAEAAGAQLLPLRTREQFLDLLASASVVVGQLRSGTLGMSELEALSLGVPVVMRLTWGHAYSEPPPVHGDHTASVVDAVIDALAEGSQSDRARKARRDWVMRHHAPDSALARLCDIYAKLL